LTDKIVKFHLLVDVASVELFTDGGLSVMNDVFFPSENYDKIDLIADQKTKLIQGKIMPLKSIWRN
jgi:sucrose-6-phosphate hydrolase SacC (GH32 family)